MKLRDKETGQIFITNSETTIKSMLKSKRYEKVEETKEENNKTIEKSKTFSLESK